jgi:hypothetical protein
MTFVLPSFGSSVISAAPASGGGGSAWNGNTYSVDFDGTNDYMDVGHSGTLGSFSLWFKPDSTITTSTGGQYLLNFTTSSSSFSNVGLGSSM